MHNNADLIDGLRPQTVYLLIIQMTQMRKQMTEDKTLMSNTK